MADTQDTKPAVALPSQSQPATQVDIALDASGDTENKSDINQSQVPAQNDPSTGNNPLATENGPNEIRIPTKKDATLREFLSKMDEHAPIIPDAVINYYLTLAGLPPPPATPLPLARLLALATQKFIADVAADAYQYSRIRASNTSSSNPMMASMPGMPAQLAGAPGAADKGAAGDKGGDKGKNTNLGVQRAGFGGGGASATQGRTVLTMEDLGMAVSEYGVNIRRGEFYR